ncbi:MAG: hypothetical protein L0154_00070 [Chloroflexi bacterium]|nr:hypothetical protein [Chloroflexota bacterium]
MVYLIIALLVSFAFGNIALRGLVSRTLPIYGGQTRILKGNNAQWVALVMLVGIVLFDISMMNYDNDAGNMALVYISLIVIGLSMAAGIAVPSFKRA